MRSWHVNHAATRWLVYHVLNRSAARLPLLETEGGFRVFLRVLAEAQVRHPSRLLGYCLMPNHWHWVLSPALTADSPP